MLPRAFVVALLLLAGCSDAVQPLGAGYFFRNEGETTRDILCERAEGQAVPSTVTAIAYDDDFIVARQRPKVPPDPLYNVEYDYPSPEQDFFWIIDKRDDSADGPLSLQEYEAARNRLGIPVTVALPR